MAKKHVTYAALMLSMLAWPSISLAQAHDWRPSEGRVPVQSGTAATLAIGAQQAPTKPPGAVGSRASVSQNRFNFLQDLGNIAGFPCQVAGGLNFCSNDSSNTLPPVQTSNCPVAEDTSGEYGPIFSVASSSSYNLSCGGAITLSNEPVSVAPAPDRIMIPESGNRITIYRRATNSTHDFMIDETRDLPANLCNPDGTFAMAMPSLSDQMVYLSSGASGAVMTASIATTPVGTAVGAAGIPNAFDDTARLVLPIRGGRLNLPNPLPADECPNVNEWIQEGVANPSSVQFTPSSSDPTCQDVTVELNAGPCFGSLQYMNLDTPALVHQPGVNATFLTIEGQDRMLTATADTSYIMMQNGSSIAINSGNGVYTFSEGAHMELDNGNLLRMSAPASVNPATGRVTLTGGGYIESAGGQRLQNFSNGAQVTPSATLPYIVFPERKVVLPAGMLLPIKPNATLRTPLTAPEG